MISSGGTGVETATPISGFTLWDIDQCTAQVTTFDSTGNPVETENSTVSPTGIGRSKERCRSYFADTIM
jgi:hypothetical protein